jgi:hypothetical protein
MMWSLFSRLALPLDGESFGLGVTIGAIFFGLGPIVLSRSPSLHGQLVPTEQVRGLDPPEAVRPPAA